MRMMSFALTTKQIEAQTKTVTRRLGWLFLKPGDLLQPVVKAQGIKAGDRVQKIGRPVRVVSVRREPLSRMCAEFEYGLDETRAEGFADHDVVHGSPDLFVDYFVAAQPKAAKAHIDMDVTRIEFEYPGPTGRIAFVSRVRRYDHIPPFGAAWLLERCVGSAEISRDYYTTRRAAERAAFNWETGEGV